MSFFVPKSNIYMYMGHGGDVIDKYGDPEIKVVPENCIYITRAVCGLSTTLPFEIFEAFANPDYEHIWRKPLEHIDTLRKIMDHPALHIHLPGCEYVDNTFYPLSDDSSSPYYDKLNPLLQLSGLVSLQDAQSIPKEDVKSIFDGQHYFIGKKQLEYSEAAYKIKQEDLLRYFAYSTYPKLIVSDEMFGHPPDIIPLRTLPEFPGYTSYPLFYDKVVRKRIKASQLMERYPGIHFNLLCRSISAFGKAATQLLRRRYSASFHNTPIGTIRESLKYKGSNINTAEFAENLQNSLKKEPINLLKDLEEFANKQFYPKTRNTLTKIIRNKTFRNRGPESKSIILNTLLQSIQQGDTEFVKEKVLTLPQDWIQSGFGAELVLEAYLEKNRSLLKFLCKLGAPSYLAFREFTNFKNTRPSRKNLMKARVLLASSCQKGATRKNGKN